MSGNNGEGDSVDSVDLGTDRQIVIDGALPADVPELRALDRTVELCRRRGKEHLLKAKRFRYINNTLSTCTFVLNALAVIVAGINPLYDRCGQSEFIVAGLAAVSGVATAILHLIRADARSQEHLNSEHRYKCLGRDICVRMVTYDTGPGIDFDLWKDVLQHAQREIDNIQAIEPVL